MTYLNQKDGPGMLEFDVVEAGVIRFTVWPDANTQGPVFETNKYDHHLIKVLVQMAEPVPDTPPPAKPAKKSKKSKKK